MSNSLTTAGTIKDQDQEDSACDKKKKFRGRPRRATSPTWTHLSCRVNFLNLRLKSSLILYGKASCLKQCSDVWAISRSDLDSSKYAVFEGFTNQNVAKNQKLIFKKIFSYCLWSIEMDQWVWWSWDEQPAQNIHLKEIFWLQFGQVGYIRQNLYFHHDFIYIFGQASFTKFTGPAKGTKNNIFFFVKIF